MTGGIAPDTIASLKERRGALTVSWAASSSMTGVMMNAFTRFLACAVVALCAGAPLGATAAEVPWNTQPKPLLAKEGTTELGAGYGFFDVVTDGRGTVAQAKGYLLDKKQTDTKGVGFWLYTQTNAGYCVQPDYVSCTASWFPWKSDEGGPDYTYYYGSTWMTKPFIAYTDVNGAADYARGQLKLNYERLGSDLYGPPTTTKGRPYGG